MSTPTTSPTAPSAGADRAAKDIFFNFVSAPASEADQYAQAIAAIIDRESPPADLTPEQIAEGLRALAERDNVVAYIRSHCGQPASFQIVEVESHTGEYLARGGTGPTYAAALSACRAAEFGKGGTK